MASHLILALKERPLGNSAIRHLHISHNAPYLPHKILHNLCFSFLLGITAAPREIENNACAEFWGANKVHCGRCPSGVCPIVRAKLQYGQQASKQHLHRKQFSTVFNKVAFKRVLTLKSMGRSHGMGVTELV